MIFGVFSKVSGDDLGSWLYALGLGSTGPGGLVLIGIQFSDPGHMHKRVFHLECRKLFGLKRTVFFSKRHTRPGRNNAWT